MKRYKISIQPCHPTRVPVPPVLAVTIQDQVLRVCSARYRICPETKTLKRWNDSTHGLDYLCQIDRLCAMCFDEEHKVEDDIKLAGALLYEIGFLHSSDDYKEFIYKYCEVSRK